MGKREYTPEFIRDLCYYANLPQLTQEQVAKHFGLPRSTAMAIIKEERERRRLAASKPG